MTDKIRLPQLIFILGLVVIVGFTFLNQQLVPIVVPTPFLVATPLSPPPTLLSSDPPDKAVDARDANNTRIGTATLSFSADLGSDWDNASNYSVTVATTQTSPDDLAISRISGSPAKPFVILSRRIIPGERFTVTHKPTNSSVCLGFLPGDVDQNGFATSADIGRLNSWVGTTEGATQPLWKTDVNRDEVFDQTDVTRANELLSAPDRVFRLPACPAPLIPAEIAPVEPLPLPSDSTPPQTITDLKLTGTYPNGQAGLNWRAPYEDSSDPTSGMVTSYDIRYARDPITDSSWSRATEVTDEPTPRAPGTVEIYLLSNLAPGTYYVAIKSQDAAGNVSALSNNLLVTIPEPPEGNEFSENLKFYEVRFYKDDSAEPLPKGKVDFIIGVSPYKDLKIYSYISFTTILGHAEIDKVTALSSFAVMMNPSELNALFPPGTTLISQDKIQKIDIEKIHEEMFPNEPDLKYGVMLDANGEVILDSNNNPTPDSSLADYQNGKTIVYPLSYWKDNWPTRFFFNFNTPAVREYAVRYSLMRQSLFNTPTLFMDDIGGEDLEFFNTTNTLHYVSPGTKEEQMKIWANHMIEILNEVKIRPDRLGRYNSGIILNNFRDGPQVGLVLLNEIDRQGKYSVFDMMMNENYFYKDGYSGNVEFYLNWTNKLKSHGKELIHVVSVDPRLDSDSDFVEDVWLWLHLVANDETHVYINRAEYQLPMRDYAIYNFTLGMPLESPHKEGKVWIRKYQRGTIRFDTTSGKIDAIQFIPNDTPLGPAPIEPITPIIPGPDPTPIRPESIVNLRTVSTAEKSATLTWAAPHNSTNRSSEAVAAYDLRYSRDQITDENWDSTAVAQASGEPTPALPGTAETYTLVDLSPGKTYQVAIKSLLATGSISPLSNLVSATTTAESPEAPGGGGGSTSHDRTPPSFPTSVTIATSSEARIILTWKNPANSDFVRVLILRSIVPLPTITAPGNPRYLSQAQVAYDGLGPSFTDANLISGQLYYYTLYAYDRSGNYARPVTVTITPIASSQTALQPPLTPAARQALILQLKQLLLKLLQQLLVLLQARAG
jgi:hypothetical protein